MHGYQWSRYNTIILRCIIVLTICGFVIPIAYWATNPQLAPTWTGFGDFQGKKDFQRAKTLWEWLQLLLVPSFLAIGAWLLNRSQKQSENRIETDRQRQKALNDYFDCMTTLLLEKQLRGPLNETGKALHEEAKKIARIRTLTVLRILDGDRKGQVVQFLYESNLIGAKPVFLMFGADLTEAKLDGAALQKATIMGARFHRASLKGTQLGEADLWGSEFFRADMTGVNLKQADVRYCKFTGAILQNANIEGTKYIRDEFKDARFDY